MRLTACAIALGILLGAPAVAQEIPTAADLDAFAQQVPNQSWYPQGYYDLRVAAAAEQADSFARQQEQEAAWAAESAAYEAENGEQQDWGGPAVYDLIDCGTDDLGSTGDERLDGYAYLANEVARLRVALIGLGYPPDMIDGPLLEFERRGLENIEKYASLEERPLVMVQFKDWEPFEVDPDSANYYRLANDLEALRQAQDPSLPDLTVDGGCGAGGEEIRFKTSPPGGQVWLISTFAFKVCTRRLPDPWDPITCRWSEIDPDKGEYLDGRYVYRVRWRDGKELRGTREIYPDYESDEEVTTITLRKSGG